MTLKSILKDAIIKWLQGEKEAAEEIEEIPHFSSYNEIPGLLNGSQYFIRYSNFLNFIESYQFPESFQKVFPELSRQANEFLEADLYPYVVWDISRGTISVTSEERLKGYFIQ